MRSLRARLLASVLLLSAAGLLALAAVTYTEQRSFLEDRIDQQVRQAGPGVSQALDNMNFKPPAGTKCAAATAPVHHDVHGRPGEGPAPNLPPGTFGQRRDQCGHVLGKVLISYTQTAAAAEPLLPANLKIGTLSTVGSTGSAEVRYRVYATRDFDDADTTVVALPTERRQTDTQPAAARRGSRDRRRARRACAHRPARRASRAAPAEPHGGDGRRDRRRRALPPRDARDAQDRGRTARPRAQRDARSPRAGVLRTPGERRAPTPVPRRRLPRAAHAARLDPRVRRAVPHGRRPPMPPAPRWRCAGSRRRQSGWACWSRISSRSPASTRHPRSSATPSSSTGSRRTPCTTPRATAPDRRIALRAGRSRGRLRRRRPAAPGAREPDAQRARAHPRGDTDRGVAQRGRAAPSRSPCATTAPGLPSASREKLFGRFWRAEGGRERGKAGAGLGLAIARDIVEAHGGEISAENAADGGAVFVVRLPSSPQPPRRSAEPVAPPDA